MPEVKVKKGIGVDMPSSHLELEQKSRAAFGKAPSKHPKARKMLDKTLKDPEVNGGWDIGNYAAVSKPRAGGKDRRIVYRVTVKDGKIMAKGE